MPKIATCPECAEPVTVPGGLAESTALRCPLCEAEYPAQELAELTAEAPEANDGKLPPELTPVEPSSETESQTETDSTDPVDEVNETTDDMESTDDSHDADDDLTPEATPTESSSETEPDSGSTEESDSNSTEEAAGLQVKCPCCDAQFGLAEVIVVSTGEELGAEVAAAIGPDGSIVSADEKPADLPSFGPSGENHAPLDVAIDTGEKAAPSAADGFNFQDQEADQRDSALAEMASAGPPRRRRENEKHPFRMIIEIVLGGVAGLAITYYGLNFFGGQRFNWFDVYLPGVAHTVEYRPAWLSAKPGQPEKTDTDPLAPPTPPITTPAEPEVVAQPEEPPMEDPAGEPSSTAENSDK